MAAVVATMVVGPLLKIVMQKVSGELLVQYKVMKGLDKEHDILKRRLLLILDIITDAEQTAADPEQAATCRPGVASWLEAIKKVAYQANEVFDEFKYEALRRKAKKEGHYDDLGFSMVKLFPTHNRFVFHNRMGRKLRKVVQAIELLVTEMNTFGFKYQQQLPVSSQWRQTDHVIFDPKGIARRSREKDNKIIVDLLVGQVNNADLTVVPIVGMGGLGKTMLAQLVYNEPKIEDHFDLLLWVCVSDNFDVDSLAKSIVKAAPEKNSHGTEAAVPSKKKNTPLDILQNLVSKRRYLLVLDDVWTREVRKWEKLKACLEHGGKGSVVLATTRDEGVAEIMGSIQAYNLGALGGQYIKEIIETTAFSRFKNEEERLAVLVNMVGEVVQRCVGSPLAAIALGSVLRNKTTEEEWKVVSNRSNICTAESGILPILNLSYNDLPQHMKQCFAFCAIFPKDYKIDVDKLMQLWIAHGFVLGDKQVRLETIAKQIFSELASRSFFQDVKQVQATVDEIKYNGSCYSRTTCKIHDLMHDVALSVMQNECALVTKKPGMIESVVASQEPRQSEWLQNTARHLFVSCYDPEKILNSSLKNSSPAMQTLLCGSAVRSSLHHPSKYSSLQALQLRLETSSFPLKPKHLHHLRYLDLSRSSIKSLPEDMSILYNLQMLNLSGCSSLCKLPVQMRYMTALRYLYTHGCPMIKSMPRDLRKLTSLQTLTCFVVGSCSNCSSVGELENLRLGGQLELRHLQNVTEKDASMANLVNKELTELTLKWTVEHDFWETSGRVDENDARVLEKLKPHDGLHTIRIHAYGATSFPTWMASLQNIVQIHLFRCIKLQWLFNHDSNTSFAFPNLTELTLQSLDNLERCWEIDNEGMQGEIIFPRLEKLFISFCKKLTVFPGHPTFPNLQDVCIEGCPELTTRAKSPKLSVLKTEGCEAELYLWVARHMTSLTNLKLKSLEYNTETMSTKAEHGLREVVDGKEKWNDLDFPLVVLGLDHIKYSGVIELCICFVHLQDLAIEWCYGLVHWPEKEFKGLVSLRKFKTAFCYNLTGYAQDPAEPSSKMSQLLPRLEYLEIVACKSLVEVFNAPASLKSMKISSCNKLESTSCRRLHPEQSESSIHQGSSGIQDASSSSLAMAEHLKVLTLSGCNGLSGVLHLPPSLVYLNVFNCDGLTSLESSSGELPLLEILEILECKTLSSLPDGPQAYASLQFLRIRDVPGMKTLPMSMEQRLGSIRTTYIDAHLYEASADTPRPVPTLLKPKTWKYAIRRD